MFSQFFFHTEMADFAAFPYTSTSEISAFSYTWPLKKILLFNGASLYRLEIQQEGTSQLYPRVVWTSAFKQFFHYNDFPRPGTKTSWQWPPVISRVQPCGELGNKQVF